jgi:mono/diheme cytochrome c family protein
MRTLCFSSVVVLIAAFTAGAAGSNLPDESAAVARGKYLVEGVALCGRCHTPVDDTGKPNRTRWLMGAPVATQSSTGSKGWAVVAPRLAGAPPGTADEFIRLLTTGIARTGIPPKPPMPQFRMTREDAQAVLAYLRSLEERSAEDADRKRP